VNADDVRRQWADRSGEFSPEYYAYRGSDGRSEHVLEVLAEHLDLDARILEVGCSAGRHLAHLREHGFEHLAGIEINEAARAVMAETYPELLEEATVHFASLQDVVTELADDEFDCVYAVETLQHVHPDDEWVFDELARVTADLLVTVEIEEPAPDAEPEGPDVNYVDDDVPLYYRDWDAVFGVRGFEQVAERSLEHDTLRAFRRVDDGALAGAE